MSGNERREYPAGVDGRFLGTLLLYDQHPAPPAGSLPHETHLEVHLNVITASFFLSSLLVPLFLSRPCQTKTANREPTIQTRTSVYRRSLYGQPVVVVAAVVLVVVFVIIVVVIVVVAAHPGRLSSSYVAFFHTVCLFPLLPLSLCLLPSFSRPCPFFLALFPFALSSSRPSQAWQTRPARRARTLDVHTYGTR